MICFTASGSRGTKNVRSNGRGIRHRSAERGVDVLARASLEGIHSVPESAAAVSSSPTTQNVATCTRIWSHRFLKRTAGIVEAGVC